MSGYFDRKGNPMSMLEWAQRTEARIDKRVATDVLPNGYWVSTIWLGLNHQFGDGPPLIFETMVFPCDANGKVADFGDLDCDRYSTEAEALAGHAALVAKWKQEPPQAVDAVARCSESQAEPPTRDA